MISSEKLAPLLENLIEVLPESYSMVDRELITHAYHLLNLPMPAKNGLPESLTSPTASPQP